MTVLGAYAAGGGLIPPLLARSTIRIRRRRGAVRLTAVDAMAMVAAGFVMCSLPPLLLMWGTLPAVVGGVVALAAWLGFRLTVLVTPRGAQVIRTLLWVIP